MKFNTDFFRLKLEDYGGIVAVSRKTGISQSSLRNYRRGALPDIYGLNKLSKLFGCKIGDLVNENGK